MSEFKEKISKQIVYQLLPRLFGNQNENLVLNGTISQNGCGKFNDINSAAIQSIKELGATHIWLTGILQHATQTDYTKFGISRSNPVTVKGRAGSPYAVSDFFEIDPDLTIKPNNRWLEFSECCGRIHSAGLKVIIDFIPNHTARQYRNQNRWNLGTDLGQRDDLSKPFHPNNSYYYQTNEQLVLPIRKEKELAEPFFEFPAKATGNDCFSSKPALTDWYETVKLNYGVDYQSCKTYFDPIPFTWEYMLEVLNFWAAKEIDGFRCDMVEMVPVEFWSWAIPKVKETKPDLVFIGEVYNPVHYPRFLNEAGFDFLYDKVDLYDELIELIKGRGNANKITSIWQKQEGFGSRMIRFLENHDEQRLASRYIGSDGTKALSAFALTVCFDQSAVLVYSGQELGERAEGESGFSGDDGKTTIFDYWVVPSLQRWNNGGKWTIENLNPEELKTRNVYLGLINFCNQSPAIKSGGFFDLQYANQNHTYYNSILNFSFLRYIGNEQLLVVCSFCESPQWLRVIIPIEAWQTMNLKPIGFFTLTDAITGERIECNARACFESDGGSAGLVLSVPSFGFKILKFSQNN